MTLWFATYTEIANDHVYGPFSTKEKAEEFVGKINWDAHWSVIPAELDKAEQIY